MGVTAEKVQRILNETNWAEYGEKVAWSLRAPKCYLYDGRVLCSYWKEWITSGRELYSQTIEGEKEFVEDARGKNPDISLKLVREVLAYR